MILLFCDTDGVLWRRPSRKIPESEKHPLSIHVAQGAPHFQNKVQLKHHLFKQHFQLTFLRDAWQRKPFLAGGVFFPVSLFLPPDQLFIIAVDFRTSSHSEIHYHPLIDFISLGFFPCGIRVPRRRFQLVALLFCLGQQEVQLYTSSSMIQKLFLHFIAVFYFEFHPPVCFPHLLPQICRTINYTYRQGTAFFADYSDRANCIEILASLRCQSRISWHC